MITLAQQDGGPNVRESFGHAVLVLRRLLAGLDTTRYSAVRPEYALILRVNGSLAHYGPEAVERPKLRKSYIQVDIVVPEVRWRLSPLKQRQYLARVVGEALSAILDKAEQNGFAVDREALQCDYGQVCEDYLSKNLD